MEKVSWREFWEGYRRTEIKSEEDLFFEVGKTVNQEPISQEAFQLSIELIFRDLELSADDLLLELCCGNGLMSVPFAAQVRQVRAVDFSRHLIENARKFRAASNIEYVCADAVSYMNELAKSRSFVPSKILLGDALCYFDPDSLGEILRTAMDLTQNKVFFLATAIPNDELKWNFYNTAERVRRYEENQRRGLNTNDAIGRWWKRDELQALALGLGLDVWIKEQPRALSDFRVNALFKSRA